MTPMLRPFKRTDHRKWPFLDMCLTMFHRQQQPLHPVRAQDGLTTLVVNMAAKEAFLEINLHHVQ